MMNLYSLLHAKYLVLTVLDRLPKPITRTLLLSGKFDEPLSRRLILDPFTSPGNPNVSQSTPDVYHRSPEKLNGIGETYQNNEQAKYYQQQQSNNIWQSMRYDDQNNTSLNNENVQNVAVVNQGGVTQPQASNNQSHVMYQDQSQVLNPGIANPNVVQSSGVVQSPGMAQNSPYAQGYVPQAVAPQSYPAYVQGVQPVQQYPVQYNVQTNPGHNMVPQTEVSQMQGMMPPSQANQIQNMMPHGRVSQPQDIASHAQMMVPQVQGSQVQNVVPQNQAHAPNVAQQTQNVVRQSQSHTQNVVPQHQGHVQNMVPQSQGQAQGDAQNMMPQAQLVTNMVPQTQDMMPQAQPVTNMVPQAQNVVSRTQSRVQNVIPQAQGVQNMMQPSASVQNNVAANVYQQPPAYVPQAQGNAYAPPQPRPQSAQYSEPLPAANIPHPAHKQMVPQSNAQYAQQQNVYQQNLEQTQPVAHSNMNTPSAPQVQQNVVGYQSQYAMQYPSDASQSMPNTNISQQYSNQAVANRPYDVNNQMVPQQKVASRMNVTNQNINVPHAPYATQETAPQPRVMSNANLPRQTSSQPNSNAGNAAVYYNNRTTVYNPEYGTAPTRETMSQSRVHSANLRPQSGVQNQIRNHVEVQQHMEGSQLNRTNVTNDIQPVNDAKG
jgi:hypothetical protein